MPNIKAHISLKSHGNWETEIDIEGDVEEVKEHILEFYGNSIISMNKAIERVRVYHEGVAKHH